MDTVQQASRLSDVMLADFKVRVASMLQSRKVSLGELQEMVGYLHFVKSECQVMPLCMALQGEKAPSHELHRTRAAYGMREDLKVWGLVLS